MHAVAVRTGGNSGVEVELVAAGGDMVVAGCGAAVAGACFTVLLVVELLVSTAPTVVGVAEGVKSAACEAATGSTERVDVFELSVTVRSLASEVTVEALSTSFAPTVSCPPSLGRAHAAAVIASARKTTVPVRVRRLFIRSLHHLPGKFARTSPRNLAVKAPRLPHSQVR